MNWLKLPISKFCKTGSGGTPSRAKLEKFYGGSVPWVKSGELKDKILIETSEHITESAIIESSAKLVQAGAVLVAMYGATVGRTALLGINAATNQAVCHILSNEKIALNKYVWYCLRAKLSELLFRRVGGAQPNISQQIIKDTILLIPPLTEQHHIVEILDQADELRRKRAAADQKTKRILPALFLKMFGDPATNPKGWKPNLIDGVVEETQYGTSVKADGDNAGIAIIRMNNINSEGHISLNDLKYVQLERRELARQLLTNGDILFNRTNSKELVGKTGIWHDDMQAVPASYLIRVRVNKELVLPEFVWALMNTPYIKNILFNKARHAIGMANINSRELRSLPCFVPIMGVQKDFVSHLKALEIGREKRNESNKQIEKLFNLLLNRAFSGELTAHWREAHLKELLEEMEMQRRELDLQESKAATLF